MPRKGLFLIMKPSLRRTPYYFTGEEELLLNRTVSLVERCVSEVHTNSSSNLYTIWALMIPSCCRWCGAVPPCSASQQTVTHGTFLAAAGPWWPALAYIVLLQQRRLGPCLGSRPGCRYRTACHLDTAPACWCCPSRHRLSLSSPWTARLFFPP